MTLHTWLLYTLAVFMLTMTPGPTVLMCMTNAVNHGARRTFFAAIGSITGVLAIMSCSAIGLLAALASSEVLFQAIKWFGVAYLFYLGFSTLLSGTTSFSLPTAVTQNTSRTTLYMKGLLVGISNPKALLFFTAFLPQFIDPTAAQLPQLLILGTTFVCLELGWLMFYASFAAQISPWLRNTGRAHLFNRLSGLTFMLASVVLATLQRAARQN